MTGWEMVGKRWGCIQPMCSKPRHSWQGPLHVPVVNNAFLDVFMIQNVPCITKKGPNPGASLGCGLGSAENPHRAKLFVYYRQPKLSGNVVQK